MVTFYRESEKSEINGMLNYLFKVLSMKLEVRSLTEVQAAVNVQAERQTGMSKVTDACFKITVEKSPTQSK
jgi:hypothetical protein